MELYCVEPNTSDTPLLKDEDTDEESPPELLNPQVTTDPFVFNAAKECLVEYSADTPLFKDDDTDE